MGIERSLPPGREGFARRRGRRRSVRFDRRLRSRRPGRAAPLSLVLCGAKAGLGRLRRRGRDHLVSGDRILEAAATAGCDVVLTEDLADGSTIRGVLIRNPFEA